MWKYHKICFREQDQLAGVEQLWDLAILNTTVSDLTRSAIALAYNLINGALLESQAIVFITDRNGLDDQLYAHNLQNANLIISKSVRNKSCIKLISSLKPIFWTYNCVPFFAVSSIKSIFCHNCNHFRPIEAR